MKRFLHRSAKLFILLSATVMFFLTLESKASSLAPDFTMTDVYGNTFSLHDFRGKVVVLDFFATWCAPCLEEIPNLKYINDKFGSACQVISISVDPYSDTDEQLRQFREDNDMMWIVALDTQDINMNYNVSAIPTIYVIDGNGNIWNRHVGYTEASVLEMEMNQAVPEFSSLVLFASALVASALAIILVRKRMRKSV